MPLQPRKLSEIYNEINTAYLKSVNKNNSILGLLVRDTVFSIAHTKIRKHLLNSIQMHVYFNDDEKQQMIVNAFRLAFTNSCVLHHNHIFLDPIKAPFVKTNISWKALYNVEQFSEAVLSGKGVDNHQALYSYYQQVVNNQLEFDFSNIEQEQTVYSILPEDTESNEAYSLDQTDDVAYYDIEDYVPASSKTSVLPNKVVSNIDSLAKETVTEEKSVRVKFTINPSSDESPINVSITENPTIKKAEEIAVTEEFFTPSVTLFSTIGNTTHAVGRPDAIDLSKIYLHIDEECKKSHAKNQRFGARFFRDVDFSNQHLAIRKGLLENIIAAVNDAPDLASDKLDRIRIAEIEEAFETAYRASAELLTKSLKGVNEQAKKGKDQHMILEKYYNKVRMQQVVFDFGNLETILHPVAPRKH